MRAVFAQEIDIAEAAQPFVIVDHPRVFGAGAEIQEPCGIRLHPGLVRLDLILGQELAALVLSGGVADLRRAAAHQRNRLMPGLLRRAASS